MKDKIIDYDPIKGFITFKDLINDLELILEDYQQLEDVVSNLLNINNYTEEIIASLLKDNIAERLDYLIYVLKDRL